jgi:CRP-like cAMP-binding protein
MFVERFPRLAAGLEREDLRALVDAFDVHDADPAEVLVAEDTPSADLFLVWDGELDVTRRTPGGDQRTVARVTPGSYFGEVSLLDPGAAGASVVTDQGCLALRLRRARLDELRTASPEAAAALLREVLQSLVTRLRAAAGYQPEAG